MFGLLNSALKAGGAKTERGKIAEARQKEIAENRIKVCVAGQVVGNRTHLSLVALCRFCARADHVNALISPPP